MTKAYYLGRGPSDFFEKHYSIAVQHQLDIVVSNFKKEQGNHVITVNLSFPSEKVLDKSFINTIVYYKNVYFFDLNMKKIRFYLC